MKKLIVLIVALLCCLAVIVALNPSVVTVTTEGYLMPTSAHIESALSKDSGGKITLQHIDADGMIYSSLFQDYEYESKTAVDLSFPMYINGGAAVQFLSEDFWLIASDFSLLTSYDGLYLTDGHTYNQDLSIADGDEFLLVSVGDSLYMNAQSAVFSTVFEDISIPANSIVRFSSDEVTFYSYSGAVLSYHKIDEMFSATITIGEHTFVYSEFLAALGIFESAIGSADGSGDLQDLQDEMQGALQDDGKEDDKESQSGAYQNLSVGDTGEAVDDGSATVQDTTSAEDESGGSNGSSAVDGDDDSDSDDADADDTGSGDSSSSSGGSGGSGSSNGNDGSVGEGTGESLDAVYIVPTVTIENIESWAYAIMGDLVINDQSGVIRKGISFTVYGNISDSDTASPTLQNGIWVYSAEEFTGSTAKLRKTFYTSQEFNLNGIQPDSEFYIQFSYSYTGEVEYVTYDEDGNEVIEIRYESIPYKSDLYQVSTQSVEEANLATLLVDYDLLFASSDARFTWQDFYITNDSEYDADDDSFENFKLNTMPYFNKLTLTLEKQQSKEVTTITISSTYLKKAMLDGGTTYTSSAVLDSNSEYTYTLVGTDKYGNSLPIEVNDEAIATFIDTLYTAKTTPSVTITEVDNQTDELTLNITVSDPNGAITSDQLYLTATEINGITTDPITVSGTWNTADGAEMSTDESGKLWLENAEDGSEYTLVINSLAFDYAYQFAVYGDYDLQPDATQTPVLGAQTDAQLGSLKATTAEMASGSLQANVSLADADVLDTGVTFSVALSNACSTPVLALVDKFTLTITDTDNKQDKLVYELLESELSQQYANMIVDGETLFAYDSTTESITLFDDGNGITIELVGAEGEFVGISLWDALLVAQYSGTDDEGIESSYTKSAVSLRVTVARYEAEADRLLQSYTAHTISYEATVMKSGHEYTLPITLSTSKFTTKKLAPIVGMNDAFIANDVIDFFGFYITDTDDAIVGTDEVQLLLYSTTVSDDGSVVKGSLLQEQSYTITAGETVTIGTVEFSGLVQGLTYMIDVVALAYNNDSGYANYKTNYSIASYTIEAGSDIQAAITLNSLDYTYSESTPLFSYTGEEIAAGIANGSWTANGSSKDEYYSDYISIEEYIANGIDVLELDYNNDETYLGDSTMNQYTYIHFYKDDIGTAASTSSAEVVRTSGGILEAFIPSDATYIQVRVTDYDYMTTYGLEVRGYKLENGEDGDTSDQDLILNLAANDSTTYTVNNAYASMTLAASTVIDQPNYENFASSTTYRTVQYLPVTPGDVYFSPDGDTGNYLYYYNAQQELVGTKYYLYDDTKFVVPENVYYISFSVANSSSYTLYRLAQADATSGLKYTLDADITVYDKDNTLGGTVYLTLEQSVVMNTDVTGDTYYETVGEPIALELSETDAGGYTAAYEYISPLLDPNTTYRLSVKGTYKDEDTKEETTLIIASQTVTTDGALIMINNAADFAQIVSYPYANFLVTADFEIVDAYNIYFYGTIDFNGHTITRPSNSTYFIIGELGTTGVLKNLVVQVDSGEVEGIVETNYGTMENIMVYTTSATATTAAYRSFFVNGTNYGTIRSFVLRFGGDVTFNHTTTSLVARYNYGTIEEGYVYSNTNAALLNVSETLNYTGGIVVNNDKYGTMRNLYTVYDMYINPANTSSYVGYVFTRWNSSDQVDNLYHAGDFYEYNTTTGKTKTLYSISRIIYNGYGIANQTKEVWSINNNDYAAATGYNSFLKGGTQLLSDADWQAQVLTSGFDIEGTVSMGYYPRLEWPTCMEKYQEYVSLPELSLTNVPELINDAFSTESEYAVLKDSTYTNNTYTNTSGYIVLRFDNPYQYLFTDISITGLDTTVLKQSEADDGFWEVTLYVEVSSGTDASYTSAYSVTSFTITNASGSASETHTISYTTQNIAFYKEVAEPADWAAINNNMTWNYRIVNDISFANVTIPGSMMINGSTSSATGTTVFSGKIDGGTYDSEGNLTGYYSLTDIAFNAVTYPSVIYNIASTAVISNLGVDALSIDGATAQTSAYAGFIGLANVGSTIDGVHVTNASVNAAGQVGSLVGKTQGTVRNSTVNSSTLNLKSDRYTVYVGGLIGYTQFATVYNCYVNDTEITVFGGSVIGGIGGLIGAASYTMVSSCYVQGTIDSDAKNIGGAVGKAVDSYTGLNDIITNVDITTTSINVGGLVGYNSSLHQDSFVMGNIFAGSSNVHRAIGYAAVTETVTRDAYGYTGQLVNAIASDDNDGLRYLYTGDEMKLVQTWVDGVGLDSQWDYTALEDGYLPKLYYCGTTTLLPGQEKNGISLPVAEEFSAAFASAEITNNGYYKVVVELESTTYESAAALSVAITEGDIEFYIDGMATSSAGYVEVGDNESAENALTNSQVADKWTYEIADYGADEAKVALTVYTSTLESAFDLYRMYFTIDNATAAIVVIDYGESIFWEVANLAQWNDLMAEHGTTVENVKITDTIDFKDTTTDYTNLVLGQLVGEGDSAGFANLKYATSEKDSGVWILSCQGVSGLSFENFTASFTTVPVYQTMASFIGYCSSGVSDLSLSNISIATSNSTAGYIGFFYEITGNATNVDISEVTITSAASGSTGGYGTGSLTSKLLGSLVNITATDIEIYTDSSVAHYVGGVVGYMNGMVSAGNYQANTNIAVSNVTIVANGSQIGGVFGYAEEAMQLVNVVVENANIQAQYSAGGIAGYYAASSSGYLGNYYNLVVRDSAVVTTYTGGSVYNTGGMFGQLNYYGQKYYLYVENTTVQGSGRVGGVVGTTDTGYLREVSITGCTIMQSGSTLSATDSISAGGVVGYYSSAWPRYLYSIVVRDTTITGQYNVGGLAGKGVFDSYLVVSRAYIAEDVTITAINANAGGIFGYVNQYKVQNCAIGATIVSLGENAGGVIGYTYDDSTSKLISATYVRGSVSAVKYAAGVIGYATADVTFSSSHIYGTIVAADLTASSGVNTIANLASASSYTTSGKVAVWENLLVNGQLATSVYKESTVDSVTSSNTPMLAGAYFCTAADFNNSTLYTTLGFGSTIFNYTSINESGTYMPTVNSLASGTLMANIESYQLIDKIIWNDTDGDGLADGYTLTFKTIDSSTGILRPTTGERTGATVVYTSGIDRINIETTQSSVTIQMADDTAISLVSSDTGGMLVNNNDGSYTYTFAETDKYGGMYNTITIGYDFATDVQVDGVLYTSTELARTVMTSGSYWYYISNDGSLLYGGTTTTTAQDTADQGIFATANIIHLWQGKALASDGTVYAQTAGAAWGVSEDTKLTKGAIQSSATPVFSQNGYAVYYNFTMSGSTYYGYRVLSLSTSSTYAVFTGQGMQYDGYILATQGGSNYFVMRSTETNSLVSYLSAINTSSDFANQDIMQFTNSFGYSGAMAVVRYEDGSVNVWNYTTGEVLLSVAAADAAGTYVAGQGTYALGSNSLSGDSTESGTATGLMSTMASAFSSVSTFAANYTSNLFSTASTNSEIPTDGSYTDSEALAASLSATDSSAAADPSDSDTDGEGEAIDDDADGTANTETGEEGTSETDENTDGADDATVTGAVVDGTGTTVVGTGTAVDGTGTTADGTDDGVNGTDDGLDGTGDADADDTEQMDADATDDTDADGEGSAEHDDALAAIGTGALGAYTVAYNAYTGQFEVYATDDIVNGTEGVQSITATLAESAQTTEAQADEADAESSFAINSLALTMLSTSERNGFVFLGVLVLGGIGVLVIINKKYRKNTK